MKVLVLVLSLVSATLFGAGSPPAQAATVRLDGVSATVWSHTKQVITVNRTSGYRARLHLWNKVDGRWVKKLGTSHARIGYGGLVWGSQRQQGSGTTPMGTFGLTDSFGKHWRQTGWNLDYRRIRSGDYWVLDNQSEHYNRYRNKSQGGFRWWLSGGHRDSSELLTDYIEQYEMAIVINFNTTRQVRHRGGAIFLHINGSGATAGCVSVPRSTMKSLMAHVDSWKHPVIAIGR